MNFGALGGLDAQLAEITPVASSGCRDYAGLSHEGLQDVAKRLIEEAVSLLGVDPPRMERVARRAMKLAELAGDSYLVAMAKLQLADAVRIQTRNREAIQIYEDARADFKRLGKTRETARVVIGWSRAAASLGESDKALASIRSARRILTKLGETSRVASLDLNTGQIFLQQGRYSQALRMYTRALALHRSLGDAGLIGAVRAQHNRGLALSRMGRYQEALGELNLARDLLGRLGNSASVARVLRSIGEQELSLGRYASALRTFESIPSEFRDKLTFLDSGALACDIADCYLQLGRVPDALSALNEVDMTTVADHEAFAIAARRIVASWQLGRHDEALELLNESELSPRMASLEQRAWLSAQRAGLLFRDNEFSQAVVVANRAQLLARKAGARRLQADSLITEGSATLALGNSEGAVRIASRARRLARELGSAPVLSRNFELLGKVAEAKGELSLARRHYGRAIDQIERYQGDVIFEFRESFAATRNEPYERLASLQVRGGQAAQALITAERAKSRALADSILGKVDLRPRGSTEAKRLARGLGAVREDYATTYSRQDDREQSGKKDRAASVHRLVELEKRIEVLIQRLQLIASSADLADLYGAASAIRQPRVSSGTTIIEFFFSGDDILRFFMTKDHIRADLLTDRVPEIERLLRAFRINLAAAERSEQRAGLTNQARNLLGLLHNCLLSGLDGPQPGGSLVIVPHGLLHYVPFHALWDGESYLVERMPISYSPSASLYEVCRERTERYKRHSVALVLGNSSGGLLPSTLDEAEAVAGVFAAPVHLESDATRELLETQGSKADLIHIAAHGRFRPDAPLFSAIDLADGPLTTVDIFDLDLRASLVTLSACETGRAAVGGGDELVGLPRAFLYAGAGGLLVSQWRVEDASTASFMRRFYQELIKGAGPGSALRTAQIEAISTSMPQNGPTHPFYWAGFQFIGADQAPGPPRGIRKGV